jgi:2,4-dichlorophenol 6-monooxygenase
MLRFEEGLREGVMSAVVETDVLVVGAGPAGASSAVFLSKHGVRTIMISRHRSTSETPRAHITNQRAMEALRDAGLEPACRAVATPSQYMEHTFWLRTMVGEEIGRIYAWGNDPERFGDYAAASPCSMCDLPQTELEPILVSEAARLGSHVKFGTELIEFVQDSGGVTAALRDCLTEQQMTVRCKYLIGADGARSRVVEQLGIPLVGQHGLGSAFNILCDMDLGDYVTHRRASLYAVIQPGSSRWAPVGVFRLVRRWDRWLVALMVPQGVEMPEPTPDDLLERIRSLLGHPTLPIRMLNTSRWTINDVVAERYSVGRVFCMGDAVHRHPPTNGLGSNTCIQDAFNLAWKLALEIKGKAHPRLLESYNAERQPVGRQIVARANKSMLQNATVWDLLGAGTRRATAATEHAAVFDTREGRDTLRAEIKKMRYEYHAHGVELNREYVSGALIDDGRPRLSGDRDRELYYEPTTRPGSSLPHAWLGSRMPSPRISTLDIAGKCRFMLFSGPGGQAWRSAAVAVAEATGIELGVALIGPYLDYEDLYGTWHELSEVQEDGCVLVRPDLHVAWRSLTLPSDPTATLTRVMQRLLGLIEA